MVAIHVMQMRVSSRAIRYDDDYQSQAMAGKLARTFTMQMQELRAMRGRGRTVKQSIKVTKETHQHVHYHDKRGASETGGQPLGRRSRRSAIAAEVVDERTALPGQDESGRIVPLPSRSRAS